MADGSRIPRNIDDCKRYLTTTTTYLKAGTPTNATRLGILPDELAQWTAIDDAYEVLYAKYSDKKNTRTTAVRDELVKLTSDLIDLDHNYRLLDRIASSPVVNITDLETFNIKRGLLQKNGRSKATTPIQEIVMPTIQPIGGGTVSFKCHVATSKSVSIIDEADSVQYLYKVGNEPPVSADEEGLKTGLSTKASFTLSLSPSSAEKKLFIYFRWYNTKHPELSGPWSTLFTTLIL